MILTCVCLEWENHGDSLTQLLSPSILFCLLHPPKGGPIKWAKAVSLLVNQWTQQIRYKTHLHHLQDQDKVLLIRKVLPWSRNHTGKTWSQYQTCLFVLNPVAFPSGLEQTYCCWTPSKSSWEWFLCSILSYGFIIWAEILPLWLWMYCIHF